VLLNLRQRPPSPAAPDLAGHAHRITVLSQAISQRLVTVDPDAGMDATFTDCACGLLLTALPRSVPVRRAYPLTLPCLPTRTITRTIRLTHAHVTRADGNAACLACFQDPQQCDSHTPFMCDTPEPLPCADCGDPVKPGENTCPVCCCTDGDSWDKDRYLNFDPVP
jgi:hypothetical protein